MGKLITRRSAVEQELETLRKGAISKIRKGSAAMVSAPLTVSAVSQGFAAVRVMELRNKLDRFERRARKADVIFDRGYTNEKTVKRLYNRMRNEGLMCSKLSELFKIWYDIDPVYALMLCNYCEGQEIQDYEGTLTKEMWYTVIAQSLFFQCREDPRNFETFTLADEESWKDFYSAVCCNMIFSVADTVWMLNRVAKVWPEETATAETINKTEGDQSAEIERLRAQVAQLQEDSRRMARETAASYNRIIKQQSYELGVLRERLEQVTDAQEVSVLATNDEAVSYELPEDDVTFVAAHSSTASRLQLLHPNWDFIAVNHLPPKYPDNPICFVNVSYIGHKQYTHVKANCGGLIIPCNAINVQRLDEELKVSYNRYLRGYDVLTPEPAVSSCN